MGRLAAWIATACVALGGCGDDDGGAGGGDRTVETRGSGQTESAETSPGGATGDECDGALRTKRLGFEDLTEGQRVADAYADEGVSFFAGGTGAATANAFGSPASGRVYVAGDHEAVDDNPTEEHGNHLPALPVTLWLHEPGEPDRPAVTDVVRLSLVWTNEGAVSRIEAYDPGGRRIFERDVRGEGGDAVQTVCIREPRIHRVVVRFGVVTAGGDMEDNAGIDDLELGPIRAAP